MADQYDTYDPGDAPRDQYDAPVVSRMWYQVWGDEGDGKVILLMSFPAEQWSEQFEQQLKLDLTSTGVTQISIKKVVDE